MQYLPTNHLIGPSGTVQNITLRVLSATSVEIRWLPPPTDSWNGIIRNYTIYVEHVESVHSTANSSQELHNLSFTQVHPSRDSPLYNNGDPHLVSLPLQFESIIISNIQESQVYQFSIVMANLAGWGEESLPIIQELPGSGEFITRCKLIGNNSYVLCQVQGSDHYYNYIALCRKSTCALLLTL